MTFLIGTKCKIRFIYIKYSIAKEKMSGKVPLEGDEGGGPTAKGRVNKILTFFMTFDIRRRSMPHPPPPPPPPAL